jgi:hypothetical protein
MYAKITNGSVDQYPYTVGHLRRDNPNTSFPRNLSAETLAAWGMVTVTVPDAPSYDARTQKLEQTNVPVQVNGAWMLQWNVANKTAEEIAQHDAQIAEANRNRRNGLLAESDWVTIKAVDSSNDGLGVQLPQVWVEYRQALRDITSHANWPNLAEGDWPVKP